MSALLHHMGRIGSTFDPLNLRQREDHISRWGQVAHDRQAGVGYEDTEAGTYDFLPAMGTDEMVGAEGEVMSAEIAAPHAEIFDTPTDAKTGLEGGRLAGIHTSHDAIRAYAQDHAYWGGAGIAVNGSAEYLWKAVDEAE